MRTHAWIENRSLALHAAVAAKIEADPSLLNKARANIDRWQAAAPQRSLAEWRQLLDSMPLDQLLELLRSTDERAVRLRQSSPFAGILAPEERRAILAQHESRRA